MADKKTMDSLKDEEALKKCPDCGSDDIGTKESERFCNKCGLVLD